MAFYPGSTETAHQSFIEEADHWLAKMGVEHAFEYSSTTNWNNLKSEFLAHCQVVVFLDARPDVPAQREAFRTYVENGGGWMGFHFAGFALTPSEFPQNWDWYHNEFLGAGSYAGNTWKPTSAILKVEDAEHPVMLGLPTTFKSAPNEWYKWTADLRTNRDIRILASIDPSSFPLGTGPKPHEIWHSGYYPVVWTHKKYRMVYFNMGHNDMDFTSKPNKPLSSTFSSEPQDRLILNALEWLGTGKKTDSSSAPGKPQASRFKVLALMESGGHHVAFTAAAKPWLQHCGEENGFEVDYLTNTAPITEALLTKYRLVLQLDFVPYGWKPEAMAAFKAYIEEGKGGWVGLHHATLLGEFDRQPMWNWFSDFMGHIRFQNYIPQFASATVRVEDRSHPCMKDVPESFVIAKEEWYTYDRSPRANVHVLANVDESTYSDASAVRMGDHPVIWTNERVSARNVYIFMGHGPWLFENKAFTTIFRNAILWAAAEPHMK